MSRFDMETNAFLEGLATFGVVFIKLAPRSKHSIYGWEHYLDLHEKGGGSRLDLVEGWLDRGFGVGFLPRNRLWVLDLDRPETSSVPPMLERLETFQVETSLFGPRVATPSGGKHAYFRFPHDFDMDSMKNHVCHPVEDDERLEWDFKMGPRTLLVAPGTKRTLKDGTQGAYSVETPWFEPAICDPRWIMPGLDVFRKPQEPFLVAPRPLKDRIVRAIAFLKRARTGARHDGTGSGQQSLARICSHLVAYLGLEPGLAFALLTNPKGSSWNDRCRDGRGNSAPWSHRELAVACGDALDSVPMQGVVDYQRQHSRMRVERSLADFADLLTYLEPSMAWMLAMDLHQWFLQHFQIAEEECSKDRFGATMSKIIETGIAELERKQKSKARLNAYVGVSASILQRALIEREVFTKSLAKVA